MCKELKFTLEHNLAKNFVVFLCPDCGRTIRWPVPSTSVPSTICQCKLPDHITQMVMVWPAKGE